jgi:hypothetical protein
MELLTGNLALSNWGIPFLLSDRRAGKNYLQDCGGSPQTGIQKITKSRDSHGFLERVWRKKVLL